MAQYSDYLIAFWDGESKGTEHMINIAYELGLDKKIVMLYDEDQQYRQFFEGSNVKLYGVDNESL